MTPFADALAAAVTERGPVALGLDPHLDRLPLPLQELYLGLEGAARREAAAEAVVIFNEAMIAAAAGRVAAVKPQFAFYEQLGSIGFAALEETCRMAHEAGLLVIGDAKRGDIASTAAAYARAILDPDGPLGCDCVTLNPWMGSDVLLPFLEYCRSAGRGVFVLVRTTNPGSALLQRHHDAALVMAAELHRMGADLISPGGWSPIGAVVGAQVHAEAQAVRARMPQSWFLVPGIGAQGGNADEALAGARADGLGALAVSSRGLLYPPGGPSESMEDAHAFTVGQIDALSARLRTAQGAISSRL